jgi:hypothetical protein
MESLFDYWPEVDQSIHQLYNLGWYRAIPKMASDTTVQEERRLAMTADMRRILLLCKSAMLELWFRDTSNPLWFWQ